MTLHGSYLAPPTEKRSAAPYWLFLLFAFYGPSINLVGEFRYVEFIVVATTLVYLNKALRLVTTLERRFIALLVLAASMHVLSDLVNDADLEGTLKRSFTYLLLATLIVGMRFLSHGNVQRLRWMIAGYCVSYVTVLYLGQTASQNYGIQPWRLGLGTAVTMAICLVPLWFPRLTMAAGIGLLFISTIHWFSSARALAAISLASGGVVIVAQFLGSSAPTKWLPRRVVMVILLLITGYFVVEAGLRVATSADLLPEEMRQKTEAQLNSRVGLLAAGRPDTATAIYAISKRPLLGYGTTNVHPEVMVFYRDLNASVLSNVMTKDAARAIAYGKKWSLGTPSHSHIFGAWVDAGVLAALCWVFYVWIGIYVLQRSLLWRHPFQPLFVLVSLLVLWDTFFSPGPIRFDVAVRFAVLMLATHVFSQLDSISGARRTAGAGIVAPG